MSTRIHERTIPSAFIRLDATMSDADAYYNVRDAQVARENHNKLMARGLRQPCLTIGGFAANDSRDPISYYALNIVPTSGGVPNPEVVLQCPIFVPPWCQALEVVGSLAYANNSGIDLSVYAKVDTRQEMMNWPTSATITVTSATKARYAGEVVVPPDLPHIQARIFTLAIDGTIYGADLKSTGTVAIRDVGVDNGRPYIDIDLGASTAINNAVYIEGRLDIYPRMGVDQWSIGTAALNGTADTRRVFLDQPFNENPQPGVDFANIRAVQGLKLHTLSVWPKAVSDFEAGVVLP